MYSKCQQYKCDGICLNIDVSEPTRRVFQGIPFRGSCIFATQLILMIHAKRARTERKGNKETLLESDESQTVQSALRAEALSRSI